ncbi:hypothetical protein IGI37_000855 [Enterococcus sp. AZ194]|uniref:PH domain-containing protein n=1 Tax=Enterococcus sp. AZ194 TaxID=2774629 RepID=UPI003F211B89
MNFYLIIGLIIIMFIIALSARVTGNPHKNIILENTISKEHLQEPEITNLRNEYKRRLLQIATILSVASSPLLLSPYDSITIFGLLVLLFVSIGSMTYCQIIYIRKMRQLLVQNSWLVDISPLMIDTKLVVEKNQKILSLWWSLPPILISVIGAIYTLLTFGLSSTTWFALLSGLGCCLLFGGLYYSIFRLPTKTYTSNTELNKRYNDLFRHHWSVITTILFWLLAPISFIPRVGLLENYHFSFVLMMGYMVLILFGCAFTTYYLYDLRNKQDKIIEQTAEYRYSGDDQYWKFGIYINPNDSRLMVADRIGMNISINLGKKAGKIIMGLTGFGIVVVLFFSLTPLFMVDFGQEPFQANLSKEELKLQAPFSHSTIDLDKIEKISLLDKLPNNRTRVNGMGTEHYELGQFTVENRKATLFVDQSSSPILKIQTKNKDYYFTSKKQDETQTLYTKLQKELAE